MIANETHANRPDVIHLSMKPQPVSEPIQSEPSKVEISDELLRMQNTIAFLMKQHGISKVEITNKRVYIDTALGSTYVFKNGELIGAKNV